MHNKDGVYAGHRPVHLLIISQLLVVPCADSTHCVLWIVATAAAAFLAAHGERGRPLELDANDVEIVTRAVRTTKRLDGHTFSIRCAAPPARLPVLPASRALGQGSAVLEIRLYLTA